MAARSSSRMAVYAALAGNVLVAATKDLVARGLKAGDLVREMATEMGGSGGGKPDMAQAGGNDPAKINAAFEKLAQLVPLSLDKA